MDMMETFRQTYLEESFEGLDVMEAGLLDLSPGTPDNEKINEIFRAAHSIKGGSGTFGFTEIIDFTHVLETLLDEMRDDRRDVTQEATDTMLQAVDVLRDMMTRLQNHEEIDEVRASEVQKDMETILNGGSSESESEQPAPESQVSENTQIASQSSSGSWVIDIVPEKELLQTGNEPIRIFRELETLGDISVSVDDSALPDVADLNPEDLHLKWQVTLTGEGIDEEDVKEVFEWIDGDGAEVTITAPAVTADSSSENAESTPQPAQDTPSAEPQTTATPPKPEAKKSAPAAKPAQAASAPKQDSSIRVDLSKIDQLVNLVGELVITQSMLSQFGEQAEHNEDSDWADKLKEGLTHLERHTRDLQESVMNIRMLPVSFAFNRMPRIVHDVSKKLGKSINLVMEGENTELDKTMLEALTDPLVHIVRNSIDHGVESPEVRMEAGKPETGTVKMAAFHQGGNILIQITDDGAGINADKVREKAIEKGVIEEDHKMSEEEIIDLIFHPGFSTADVISDVSGRGVGMDVVRRNIRGLGGSVEVKTVKGEGSVFTIRLPLTLAILDGQLAKVGSETYVFPLVSIVESIQVDKSLVKGIAGQTELYKLRDNYIPVIRLHQKLGIKDARSDLEEGLLVVVEDGGKRAGIFVDDLLGQQQVVIKSLESNFMKIKSIAGATILGDGTVSLILDVTETLASHKGGNLQSNAA
ncbi:chemotaxis protein CheA [Hydrogenovibrio sp. 3SP14C1]|uniref:chemotaxis protein CheA n=1 Tax=Hydrogenovibrio sp. 3SP14C1 TaxID=3038774 RepID=UPI0024171820|nr:chemotaxis protein CheA [Hydrogenovibrio sp. 3SP14C1]MDG4812179.1 chemotaxis protein CheA [Hydrogenovibrio sp. 3SP14C1]